MRWFAGFLGFMLCWLALAGCQQTCFVREPDLFEAHERLNMPQSPETDLRAGVVPFLPKVGDPATVVDPDRKPRYLTLQEAFALALENGTTGSQSVRAPGIPIDDLVTFTGSGVAGSDRIRVFALSPAINAAALEGSLARFDTQWLANMNWITNDNPVQGLNSFTNGEQGQFSTSLAKPLPTGGVAGITFNANYLNLISPPAGFFFLNPSYTTNLQLGFEQPLLRFSGMQLNQLLPAFPNSLLFSGINSRQAASSAEGILITRIRFDQQRADFERRINFMLLNVEVAYWTLYGSYVTLFSADQGLRQAHESWRVTKEQYDVGKADPVLLNQVRAQYEQFRIDRLTAINTVLENERVLRIFLGMKMEDGQRLVPADAPTLAPYVPNWHAAFEDALSLRPELVLAREDLKAKQLALVASKTLLQPDLRFTSTYTLVGLGTRLDGGGYIAPASPISFNSLNTLAASNFVNWNIGLTMNMPIGFRNELAQVRAARLALAQAYEVLKDQEKKAHNFLAHQYRQVIATYKIVEARRLRRLTLAQELRTLTTKVEAGLLLPTDRSQFGDSLLDAQRLWAAALSDEYTAIVDYNNALVLFEFAKGTIQHHDRIYITEGPLPRGAQVSAVEHERQRTRAVVLHERQNPFIQRNVPTRLMPDVQWPDHMAPPLPSLWQDGPPMSKTEPATSTPEFIRDAASAHSAAAPVIQSAPRRPPTEGITAPASQPLPDISPAAPWLTKTPAAKTPAAKTPAANATAANATAANAPMMAQTPPLMPKANGVDSEVIGLPPMAPAVAPLMPAATAPPFVTGPSSAMPPTTVMNPFLEIRVRPDNVPTSPTLGVPGPLRELPALPMPSASPAGREPAATNDTPQLGAPLEP